MRMNLYNLGQGSSILPQMNYVWNYLIINDARSSDSDREPVPRYRQNFKLQAPMELGASMRVEGMIRVIG